MATVLDLAIVSALDALHSFAHQENFWDLFETAFGSGYDRPTVQRLRAQWQAGDTGIFPTLAVVTQEILGTASGAYGNGTIYLSEQFLANASETGVVRVLLEEYGHFVDAQVNTLDSPGDEGAIFAALVEAKIPEGAALSQLKTENDRNWISVDGERLLIEQSSPGTVIRTPIAPASPERTRYEYRNRGAFAALKSDGSVVTWGFSFWGGDSSSVASQLTSGVSQIFSNGLAFAALKSDGSVVTWGYSDWGGNSSSVASQLTSGVSQIFSNYYAFAALKSDGSVVTWGDSSYGGNSSSVASQLTSGVSQIFSTNVAFAALKSDGSVVTWGDSSYGGNSSIATWNGSGYTYTSVASQLTSGVSQIFSTRYAFAALKSDGSVVTWGYSDWGGNSSSVASQLTSGVSQIFSTLYAFAALKSDGSVVTWGYSDWGGNSSSVASQLTSGVSQIFSTRYAFAALKSDGSVVTWGDSSNEGDSSSVASQLTSGVSQIFSSSGAFAALKSDGSVVTWGGDSDDGGNSSIATWNGSEYTYTSIASQLTSGVSQIFSTDVAFAALKSDGSVVTWGHSDRGGDSSSVASQLTSGVSQIFSTDVAFAALKSDGSVVTWGDSSNGGDSSSVASQLTSGVVSFADPFNDDRLVPLTESSVTLAISPSTVAEDGTSNLIYTFTRTGVITDALTVNYTIGGTATNGTDYGNIGTSVTFAANSATATVTVDPTTDTTVETDETVSLTLASGTGYTIGTTSAVTGTITNDDAALPSITLAVNPTSVLENGTSNLAYTFTRTGSTTSALTVNYTVGGTATLGTDYTGISSSGTTKTVTFSAGSTTAIVTVDPTADTTVEPDETVALTLAAGTGYTIATTSAVTGTITNDDVALPTITLAVSPSSVTEDGTSNLVYTFTRTGVTSNALTVNYTVGGTATNGTDYGNIGTSVTFAANSATATVTVDPTADTTVETDETVTLTLATGTGYTIGTTSAVTGTIANDDIPTNFQQITSSANLFAAPGSTVNVPLSYNTTTGDNTLPGIGFRLHYDSRDLTYEETNLDFSGSLFGTPSDLPDTENFDNDSNTDRYVQVQYIAVTGNWPNQTLPLKLGDFAFTATATFAEQTQLNITGVDGVIAVGYGLQADSLLVRQQTWNLDIDGDGSVRALSDGIMAVRYMLGAAFAGDKLIQGAISPTATRNLTEIQAYLQQGVEDRFLDIDADGSVGALSDGIMVVRYMFGAAFAGDKLTEGAIAPGATRDLTEIRDYLAGLTTIV